MDVELSGQACLDGPRFVHAVALSRPQAGRVTWVDRVSAATVVATFACLWLMRIFDFALLSVLGLSWPMAAAIPSVAATFGVDATWRRFLISGLGSHVVPAPKALLQCVEIVGLAHGDTEPISAAMIALRLARFSGGVPGQRHEPPPADLTER